MATIISHGHDAGKAATMRHPLPADPSCQPCPDCGGLECLCRPRFFAGQLLSEQDLNRLDHYIIEKHKLHNRHLHGSGVVCGLEVKCSPCDTGMVTVTAGYALSPCGEDIVVCKPDMVDVCALIARCRVDTDPDCAPYRGQESCGDVIEDWVLSVRYAESPSRGITALTGAGQGCCCSCGTSCSGNCSGSGGGSCGCGGGKSCSCGAAIGKAEPEALRQPRLNRGSPPSCEPTLTCETYRYDVFRAPVEEKRPVDERLSGMSGVFAQLEGEMMARITCCIKLLEENLPKAPGSSTQPIPANMQMAWFKWGCQMKLALANYFVRTGGHDCEVLAKLQMIIIPSPAPNQSTADFEAAIKLATFLLALIVFEAMVACICSNALPPCPAPGDPRVPLAVVKVRRRDCHVVSVCNWHPLRKHVLTFPTLEYWFGFIPIARVLREGMHKMCCDLFGMRDVFDRLDQATPNREAAPAAAGVSRRAAPDRDRPAHFAMDRYAIHPDAGMATSNAVFEALSVRHAATGGAATWGDLLNATLERPRFSLDPNLAGKERDANLRTAADSGPIGMLAGMFGPAMSMVSGKFGVEAQPASAENGQADLAKLKATVAAQSRDIKALKALIVRATAASVADRAKPAPHSRKTRK